MRKSCIVNTSAHFLDHITYLEIRTGQIDRLRHDVQTLLAERLYFLYNTLDHKQVKLVYYPMFLKHRDEIRRGHKADHGVDPPCQSLLIADSAAYRPDDRLIPSSDPAFHCLVEVCDYILLFILGILH